MSELKYTVINNKTQYKEYCNILESLVFSESKEKKTKEEISLLTLLIEKWDDDHNSFDDLDPVQLLRSLMDSQHLRGKDLVEILNVSKGYVSDLLNYKKGFSKDSVRILAAYFKVAQEAFNRPYKLKALSHS